MTSLNTLLNTTLNHVHHWGEPEEHPMKRMFLTRATTVGCAVLEAIDLLWSTGRLAYVLGKEGVILSNKMYYQIKHLEPHQNNNLTSLKVAGKDTIALIAGLASTILIGSLFSPEVNFRVHIKLGLAVDSLAARKQKDLEIKLRIEANAAEVTKQRAIRFAQFEAERDAAKRAQAVEDSIDAHLAELLYQAKY